MLPEHARTGVTHNDTGLFPAVALVALICAACFPQNLILVLALKNWWQPHSFPELLIAALYKSAPLILFTLLFCRYRERLLSFYEPAPKIEMSLTV